jgi:mannose-6-phosphate isomerase
MGTHPSLPSKLVQDKSSLLDHLKQHPELLGDKVRKYYGSDDLPFLFKVLAIGKALSIQAHPDKELGKKLHAERPDVYKGALGQTYERSVLNLCNRSTDPNHKVTSINPP